MTYRLVSTQPEFESILPTLLSASRLGVDTEFHREGLYYPRLALVQIQDGDTTYLLDPLSLDLTPLQKVFESVQIVMHASSQDMEVFLHVVGSVPKDIYDTQLAAAFLGMNTPSLANLTYAMLGTRLEKASRLTDWLYRPLTPAQLKYAANDVIYLLPLADKLSAQLKKVSRLQWFDEDRAHLHPTMPQDPDEAWRRIKGSSSMKGSTRALAQAVAAWREKKAAHLDKPTKFILSDLAMQAIIEQPPKNLAELSKVRGIDSRRTGADPDLFSTIVSGVKATPPPESPRRAELPPQLRPLSSLASAWLSQLARDLDLDTTLLATKDDLDSLLAGRPSRLSSGWRADLVGFSLGLLRSGNASVSVDKSGRLVLEARSNTPLSH